MANLDETQLLLRAIEGAEKPADAVAWITVKRANAPRVKSLQDEIGNCFAHDDASENVSLRNADARVKLTVHRIPCA
jgi:hypothetical protein